MILDIDYCYGSLSQYYYRYNIDNSNVLNFTEDCSIRTALQCSHDSDAAVECVGEWTNRPGSDFYYHLPFILIIVTIVIIIVTSTRFI